MNRRKKNPSTNVNKHALKNAVLRGGFFFRIFPEEVVQRILDLNDTNAFVTLWNFSETIGWLNNEILSPCCCRDGIDADRL